MRARALAQVVALLNMALDGASTAGAHRTEAKIRAALKSAKCAIKAVA